MYQVDGYDVTRTELHPVAGAQAQEYKEHFDDGDIMLGNDIRELLADIVNTLDLDPSGFSFNRHEANRIYHYQYEGDAGELVAPDDYIKAKSEGVFIAHYKVRHTFSIEWVETAEISGKEFERAKQALLQEAK